MPWQVVVAQLGVMAVQAAEEAQLGAEAAQVVVEHAAPRHLKLASVQLGVKEAALVVQLGVEEVTVDAAEAAVEACSLVQELWLVVQQVGLPMMSPQLPDCGSTVSRQEPAKSAKCPHFVMLGVAVMVAF